MTHFLDNYQLNYTPLSPIHIGTGNSYEPTNYFIDNNTLYEFDTGSVLAAFSAQQRAELVKITRANPDTQLIKAVQRFFYDQRETLKPWVINAIPVYENVAKTYLAKIGRAVNIEANGSEVFNRLEIDRTAINPITHHPVLFGSSLKGAIRTAILNHLNNSAPLTRQDAGLFDVEKLQEGEKRRRIKEQSKIYPKLNQRLLQFQPGQFQLDPLRLFQISDAAWNKESGLPSAEIRLTVNRKKNQVKDKSGKELFSQAEKNENLCKQLECIPAWQFHGFTGQVNLQLTKNLKSIPTANQKLPNSELCFSITEIAKHCNSFYKPILINEMELLASRGFICQEWQININKVLSLMADKFASGEAFLLRVGRHSGAESVTLNGVRHIYIMNGNPEFQLQTKTWWLAAENAKQRINLLPFGWLLVEVDNTASKSNSSLALAELCEQNMRHSRKWATEQVLQQNKLSEQRLLTIKQKERENEELQKLAEQHAKEELDRIAQEKVEQQRLASLSPLDKEIEDILNATQTQEHDTRLLQELEKGRWQGDDAVKVAQKVQQLMQERGKWLPDFTGDNKTKAKNKERSLKVLKYLN